MGRTSFLRDVLGPSQSILDSVSSAVAWPANFVTDPPGVCLPSPGATTVPGTVSSSAADVSGAFPRPFAEWLVGGSFD